MKLQFGFCFGTSLRGDISKERLWDLVGLVEQEHYDSIWFYNNNGENMPRVLELCKEVASRTSRLMFGPHVLVAAGLERSALINELADIYKVSNGRFVAQLGIGGPREALIEDPAAAAVELERILREIEDFSCDRSAQAQIPPVWLGGNKNRTVRRVANLADGWVPSFITPTEYAERLKVMREEASHLGRSAQTSLAVQVVYLPPSIDSPGIRKELDLEVSRHKPGALGGDVYGIGGYQETARIVSEFAEVGVDHVILVPARAVDDWEAEIIQLKREVIDSLRGNAV